MAITDRTDEFGITPITATERAALLRDITFTLDGGADLKLYADLEARERRAHTDVLVDPLEHYVTIRRRVESALWLLDDLVVERDDYCVTMPPERLLPWLDEIEHGTLDSLENSIYEPGEADADLDIINACRSIRARVAA